MNLGIMLALGAVAFLVQSVIVEQAWNVVLVPAIDGVRPITYKQAMLMVAATVGPILLL